MPIDISDLDIKILFQELWKNAITASFFNYTQYAASLPLYIEPENYNTGFWYHCGRPIKIDFSDLHNVSYGEYDLSNGEGKFMEIVSRLRKN
jgi:hypothetical protein